MRRMTTVVALALAACASGSGGAGGSGVREILRRAGSSESNPPRDGSEYFVVDTLPGTVERTFNAVRYTYESLGLAFTYYEPDQGELGGNVPDLRQLDHEPPSTWMTCGQAVIAGDNADLYNISLTVATKVLPLDANTTAVHTVLRARSFQRDHSSYITRCATRGELERRIADGALALLLKYGPGPGG